MVDEDAAPGMPGAQAVNAADENALRHSARREKDKRRREQNDLREVMSRPEGRRVMWRILVRAGIYTDCFTGNSSTFFNEGKRSIGLQLMADLEAAAKDRFIDMWKENGFTNG